MNIYEHVDVNALEILLINKLTNLQHLRRTKKGDSLKAKVISQQLIDLRYVLRKKSKFFNNKIQAPLFTNEAKKKGMEISSIYVDDLSNI